MRRLARPHTLGCCPEGQVARPLLAALLAVSLALPARAQEPASPEASTELAPTETAAPASAQDEALRLFREAKLLYGAGRHAEAARGFEASFAAAESPEAAYNAALAHDREGALLPTMAWFRRYLEIADRERDASYPLAIKRVEELRARLGELQLQLDSSDEVRAIEINGEAVALTEFPRLVEPGRALVRLIGDEPGEVVDIPADLAPGGTWTIHFTGFAKEQEPAPTPRPGPVVRPRPGPDPEAVRRARTLARLTWTGVALTGASAITAGVFGGLALRSRDAANARLCPQGNVCPGEYDAWSADAAALARHELTTNVMIGVTAGLAVITLALGLASLRERRKLRERAASGRLRLTLAGLQLAF